MSTPLRILIIENHSATAAFISLYLGRLGHHAVVAPSAEAVLNREDLAGFDVILSDIGLPDVNGWDLMKQLRPLTDAFAIAMSGFGGEADVQRSLAAGYQLHLVKPFVPADLEDALLQVSLNRQKK